jgi:hypothetical protein
MRDLTIFQNFRSSAQGSNVTFPKWQTVRLLGRNWPMNDESGPDELGDVGSVYTLPSPIISACD